MNRRLSIAMLMLVLLALAAFGGRAILGQAAERNAAEAASTVEEFYRWYLAYPGNPFAERAHRQSPLLSDDFKVELDAELEAMRAAGPGGADLVLCAQDIPGEMRYGPAELDGDSATVVVEQVWNPGTEFETVRELSVTLEKTGGKWLIIGITCPAG